jgi:hypothetical protein
LGLCGHCGKVCETGWQIIGKLKWWVRAAVMGVVESGDVMRD